MSLETVAVVVTLGPLAVLHVWLALRARRVLRFQLMVDLLLLVVTGPALLRGLDLDPIRVLEGIPPYGSWEWSEHTQRQPVQSDLVLQFHPWWEAARDALLAGRFPALQPRVGAGVPLYGNGQCGLLAPQMVAVWALGPETGTTVMAFWKLELAGLGAFCFLALGLRARKPAPEVGGALWAGSPYLIGWLLVPLAWVVALLPWLWWLGLRLVQGRFRWRRGAATAVVWGWVLAAGLHPETAVIVVGSAALWAAMLRWRRAWRPALALSGAVVMAAVLTWPTISFIAVSSNARHAVASAGSERPLPPGARLAALAQTLLPASQGHPAAGDWRAPYPQPVGALGLGGAGLAVLCLAAWRRRRWAVLSSEAVLGVLAGLLVFRTPPLDLLLPHLPGLRLMTLPRFGVLVAWSLTLASALAVEALGASRRCRWGPMVVAGLLALVTALSWRGLSSLSHLMSLASCVAALAVPVVIRWNAWRELPWLVAVELSVLGIGINPVSAPRDRLPMPGIMVRLSRLARDVPGRMIALDGVLPANLAPRYGLADLRSYDPLRPWPLARLHALLGAEDPVLPGPLHRAPPRLLGAWSVRWVLAPEGRDLEGWRLVDRGDGVSAWENPWWRSEVRLARRVVVAPSEEAGWELLGRDPALLPDGAVLPPDAPVEIASPGSLRLVRTTPDRIEAEVSGDAPQLLVVARCWLPGWSARVDGRRVPVLRANLAGLGVAVGAGRHRVELRYSPWAGWGRR